PFRSMRCQRVACAAFAANVETASAAPGFICANLPMATVQITNLFSSKLPSGTNKTAMASNARQFLSMGPTWTILASFTALRDTNGGIFAECSGWDGAGGERVFRVKVVGLG